MTAIIPPELLPDGAKGLVLDCDGTLMDTMSQHSTSWRLACTKFGIKMTVQQFIGYEIICCIEHKQTYPAVLRY
jgi:beta-phosphoglucomutase-like phosphatase (HAD superfamily)